MWLALAGAGGTLCRVGLSAAMTRGDASFPWGTLAVNVLGSLLFGLVWSLAEGGGLLSSDLKWVILGGFMGSFTTFSTFAFDAVQLLQHQGYRSALVYVLAQNLLGVGAVTLGIVAGRAAWS